MNVEQSAFLTTKFIFLACLQLENIYHQFRFSLLVKVYLKVCVNLQQVFRICLIEKYSGKPQVDWVTFLNASVCLLLLTISQRPIQGPVTVKSKGSMLSS